MMKGAQGGKGGKQHRQSIIRNTVYNFLGQAFPMVVALVAIPVTLDQYGVDVFGLISLAWLLLGFFAFLDLGLGRATVNAVARCAAEDDWTSAGGFARYALLLSLLAGGAVGAAAFLVSPWLASVVFNIPPGLLTEAEDSFRILAVSVPVVTGISAIRAVLEGSQRFGQVNLVKGPSNALLFAIPMVGGILGWGIAVVISLMVISRVLAGGVYFLLASRAIPRFYWGALPYKERARPFLQFGLWVTVSSFLAPFLTYGERLIIPSMLGLAPLAYYTAPYEMISRIAVIPASFAFTLMPEVSFWHVRGSHANTKAVVNDAVVFLLAAITPLVACFILFAREILSMWLGGKIAAVSSEVVQILATAFLFNSVAYIFLAVLQGVGRPDLKAKLDIGLSILLVTVGYMLIATYGIAGAAAAKLVILSIDAGVLVWLVAASMKMRIREFLSPSLARIVLIALSSVLGALGTAQFTDSTYARGALLLIVVVTSVSAVAMDPKLRNVIKGMLPG